MKITAQEEYGIRILLRIANSNHPEGITIPQISNKEGLSHHYVAKLCRILRLANFIKSTRGKEGGYTLNRSADRINLNEVLNSLGGKLYSGEFCQNHSGVLKNCCHKYACSVRSIWELVQNAVDQVLNKFSLRDLLDIEHGESVTLNLTTNKKESLRSIDEGTY